MQWSRVPAATATAVAAAAMVDSDDDGSDVARTQFCGLDLAECFYPGAAILLLHILASALFLCCVLLPPELQQPPSSMSSAAVHWWTAGLLLLSIAVAVLLFLVVAADAGFRPDTAGAPLSHHCPVCHVVVDDFDHHCGVLGACIGRGNMHYFLSWLLLAALVYALGAVLCVRYLCVVVYESGFVEALRSGDGALRGVPHALWLLVTRGVASSLAHVMTLVLLVGAVYSGAFCGVMGGFYLYLCTVGKHSVQRRRLRPRHGGLRSVFAGFCRPRLARTSLYTSRDTRMQCA